MDGEVNRVPPAGISLSGPGAVTTCSLHRQRYFCRRCLRILYSTPTTVISSDSSAWSPISTITWPQIEQIRSSSAMV
jgi:hypothetical protein